MGEGSDTYSWEESQVAHPNFLPRVTPLFIPTASLPQARACLPAKNSLPQTTPGLNVACLWPLPPPPPRGPSRLPQSPPPPIHVLSLTQGLERFPLLRTMLAASPPPAFPTCVCTLPGTQLLCTFLSSHVASLTPAECHRRSAWEWSKGASHCWLLSCSGMVRLRVDEDDRHYQSGCSGNRNHVGSCEHQRTLGAHSRRGRDHPRG